MSRAQLRRLKALEAHKQHSLEEQARLWWDTLLERFELEEIEQLDSYHRGDRTPTAIAAWAEWEAFLHSHPEVEKRLSGYLVGDWWLSWADVWQRA